MTLFVLKMITKENKTNDETGREMKKILNLVQKFIGLKLLRYKNFQTLISKTSTKGQLKKYQLFFDFLMLDKFKKYPELIGAMKSSKSQFIQDIFVINQFDFKEKGFFVEFGAANGIDFSNTYMLEKSYNWTGIIAEPAKTFHKSIENNRNCHFSKFCVWNHSGDHVEFNETTDSTLSFQNNFKNPHKNQKIKSKYKVRTISLNDMLELYNSPKEIDYISVDTEGSELKILHNFNFDKFKVKIFTIEHNFNSNRQKIFNLLTSKGYKRIHMDLSDVDDWYILS